MNASCETITQLSLSSIPSSTIPSSSIPSSSIPSSTIPSIDETDAEEFERTNVHEVYDKISTHFSNTRYKVWKSVKKIIESIPSTASVLEVGCGNGKNLKDMSHVKNKTGCDMSPQFVDMVLKMGIECRIANILNLPHESEMFDYVLCIAVLHHLSTENRRKQGIDELIRVTKPGGVIFIQVWALEQPAKSKRQFNEQDSLVSWDNIEHRYYHLFVCGELEKLVKSLNVNITDSFYEDGNWVMILKRN
jgi:ubiquinone/menaquinone biosynthesis C-methylase UbiE